MDKLLEVKIGGGDVHSGWLPLSAFRMLQDLLDAIAEEGTGDSDLWKSVEPQVELVGKSSTLVAVHTPFAKRLRKDVSRFRARAQRLSLGPQGQTFVKKHVATSSAQWSYVTLIEVPEEKERAPTPSTRERTVRFDAQYKERLSLKQPAPLHGLDEIYATVIRAGGEMPTATLSFLNGSGGTYAIRGANRKELARCIAKHLYETVRLQVEAWWNASSLELENLIILDILDWQDVHLAQVYRDHGDHLPIKLTVESVEELLAEREEDRSE